MSLCCNSRLLNFIANKQNSEEVKLIVKSQNLYNAVSPLNNTLLHYAAQAGNREILKYLIDSGSIVDPQNFLGQTPLMIALNSDKKCARILVRAGANIYKRNLCGISALRMIGSHDTTSNRKLLDLFFQRVQNDCMNRNKWIAGKLLDARWILPKVVLLKKIGLTKIMLQRGCHVEARDSRGRCALHVAVTIGSVQILKLLLDYNANINCADLKDRASLFYVCADKNNTRKNNQVEILKILLERGLDITRDFKSKGKWWPDVCHVLWNGNREAVQLLLQTDNNFPSLLYNIEKNTLAHFLAANPNPGVIELLRGKIDDLNSRNGDSETPLAVATSRGVPHAVQFLIDEGADMEDVDFENWTALAHAVALPNGSLENVRECVKILLERGANAQIEIHDFDEPGFVDITIFDIIEEANFQFAELIISHLALQEALGTPLTELIRDKIHSDERLKTCFEFSQQQLSLNIYKSITFFDLLTESEMKLERYVRNRELYLQLTNFNNVTCQLYYFKSLLQKRISKAIHTIELKKKAAHIVCKIMKINYESYHIIADEIASYLRQEDVENLLNSFTHLRDFKKLISVQ